jgi:hypothetical protein
MGFENLAWVGAYLIPLILIYFGGRQRWKWMTILAWVLLALAHYSLVLNGGIREQHVIGLAICAVATIVFRKKKARVI